MKQFRRDSSNHRNRSGGLIVTEARKLGLKLPEQVTAAAALVDALESRLRALPDQNAARAETVGVLLGKPDADIAKLAASEVSRDVLAGALAEAAERARAGLATVVLQNADAIVLEARTEVFEPAAAKLAQVAAIPAGLTLTDLVAAKRHADAEALSLAQISGEQVTACLTLRDRLARGEAAGLSTRVWRNGPQIDWSGAESLTGTDRIVEGLRRGGELWLGLFSEIFDTDRQATAAAKAQKAADAAEHHRRMHEAMTGNRARRSERAKSRA